VILSVVNAASFHPNGAPAAIMTIFGRQLSDAIYQATTYPLPTQLGPTRVLVNGAAVPLFYVSPGQINFQMPSTTPIGTPQVVVDTGLLQATSSGYPAALSFVDPGLFVTPDKRASALNQDLSIHTAATPQPAGALILLYLTGNGLLTPPLPDGTAAPSSPLSPIGGTTQVTIGGKTAVVMYAGEAPGFAGLSQINAVIPVDLAPGDQPVFVSISGLASNAGLITVR
jgi:adhesin/invasin